MAKPMPAIFFGHGNPMNALARNAWTRAWSAIGNSFDFRSESERSIGGKTIRWQSQMSEATKGSPPLRSYT
jgi:hypothetical protein